MKTIILLISLSIPLILPAQKYYFPKAVPDKHQLPNVVAFDNQFLYISVTELSNKEYEEYLTWLKINGSKGEYENALWDTAGWKKLLAYSEPYVKYYQYHSIYDEYPAVNISQQQARVYCRWLQDSLTDYLKSINSPIEKIIVRLPTESEWMKAARKGLWESSIFPWGIEEMRRMSEKKCRGCVRANVKMSLERGIGVASQINDNGYVTTPIKSYWPNEIGLWNMSGNVAEWIDESGKTKGGSWNLPPYHARIDVPGFYDGDSSSRADIGFRYVIEIVSVKNLKPLEKFKADKKYFKENFAKTKDSIYAQITELSNKEFLQFLLENPDPSLKINKEAWNRYFPYAHYQMYGWQEAWYNRPVVNISYEAAVKYCEWLTAKYHKMLKREFKKVVFRLPTHDEWEWAARGGLEGAYFPWGGPHLTNSIGYFIANFAPREEYFWAKNDTGGYEYKYPGNDSRISWGRDGLMVPGHTKAYFPNDYGLYNCSGNVAEMVSEKGHSRGGAWRSEELFIRIATKDTYSEPGPTVGFRVFMEILER